MRSDSTGDASAVAALAEQDLKLDQLPTPAGGVLLSPWVDLIDARRSTRINAKYDYLPRDLIEMFASKVGADRMDPLMSPIRGKLECLPPTLVQVGQVEVLRDQIEEFALKSGASITIYRDMVHVFQAVGSFVHASCNVSVREIGAFVNSVARRPVARPIDHVSIGFELHSAQNLCSKVDAFDWNIIGSSGIYVEASIVDADDSRIVGKSGAAPRNGNCCAWGERGIDNVLYVHVVESRAPTLELKLMRGGAEIRSSASLCVGTARLAILSSSLLYGVRGAFANRQGGSINVTLHLLKNPFDAVIPSGTAVTPIAPNAKVYKVKSGFVSSF